MIVFKGWEILEFLTILLAILLSYQTGQTRGKLKSGFGCQH